MFYQKKISWWQQRRWFKQINNKYNFYFLIQHNDKFIGLINGKDIDLENRTCEGGIFVWEKEYWDTYVPVAASIILNDFNFIMANFKINYAKVLKFNNSAVQYNLNQGYKIIQEQSDGVIVMNLLKHDYLEKSKKSRGALAKISKDFEPMTEKNISFKDDNDKEMKLLYTGLPQDIQELVVKIIENDKRANF
ncbi:MAG: hypothetical protein A3K10_13600 [Bacteroidetes bacterium RIFCSPLOWO2_12_FULL_31_6]|nr:MAG: hypothetical protein A3K10_13600 [Bacteroidetes bacterium RIFCSPLOWO2_12_FULL_31_6]